MLGCSHLQSIGCFLCACLLFARSFVRSFFLRFGCLLVRLFVCSSASSFVGPFACLLVLFFHAAVCELVVDLVVPLVVRSLVRSFVCFFLRLIC